MILGIDPSLKSTGWGIITIVSNKPTYVASGLIRTSTRDLLVTRLGQISLAVQEIMRSYSLEHVAMEEVFINKNFSSSINLVQARGTIMSVIGQCNVNFSEYAPNKIKKTIVGTGAAEKQQVQHMIKLLMSIAKDISHDEADALATAYTALTHNNLYSHKL